MWIDDAASAVVVACPEKTKVNFHATHMCNMAKLNSREQTVASSLRKLPHIARRCCCCNYWGATLQMLWLLLLSVECNICRQFLLCDCVKKTCAAAHPPLWQGVRPHPLPLLLAVVPCIFYACLMSCLKIYCHKLMQVASFNSDRNRKTTLESENASNCYRQLKLAPSPLRYLCLLLSLLVCPLFLSLSVSIHLYLSLSLSISPHCVLNKLSFLSSSHCSYALFNPAATWCT